MKIQRTLRPQTPMMDTHMGITELPRPRMLPTMVSMMPQRKYVVPNTAIRFKPNWITSGSEE